MKKLMYIAAALLVLVGCNKDNALNNAPEGTPFKKGQQVTLTIGTGDNANQVAPRKVAGVDNGTTINFTWEEGDQILVKVGQKSAVFTLSSEPGLNEGEFVGTMPAAGSTFDIQYPVEAPDLSAQEYTTDKTIPADKMLFTATGCTLGESASLAAQDAMVQLNLFGTDKTVGKIVFTNKTVNPAVSYTLTCTGGMTIAASSTEATPFYMVVPVGEYQFEVEVYDNAATPAMICSFATSAEKTFIAGDCLNMPAKEVASAPAYVAVDLGLSVKWATMNVGATAPEGYGDYFAWGETKPYYVTPITNPIIWNAGKTNGYSSDSYTLGEDIYDATTKILKPAYDAAAANWEGAWRMPTKAEWEELKNNCTWTATTLNSVNGVEVKGTNGNTIFLPFAGYLYQLSLMDVGSYTEYWSSSRSESYTVSAYLIGFTSTYKGVTDSQRIGGKPVRPVCE